MLRTFDVILSGIENRTVATITLLDTKKVPRSSLTYKEGEICLTMAFEPFVEEDNVYGVELRESSTV